MKTFLTHSILILLLGVFWNPSTKASDKANENPPPPSTCTSSASQPWQEWIKRIHFGRIDHYSSKEGYGHFLDQRNRIDVGSTQPISLTTGFSYTNYDEYWSVWIDWNQDNEFQDTELAFQQMHPAGTNGNLVASISGTISIPDNATIGTAKMRVSMKRDAFANACEHFDFGEVEDYSIFISPQGTDDVLNGDDPLMVVGDRKINAITVINTVTDLSVNIPMPFQATDNTPGFTYVVYEPHIKRVFIGDMVNDRLVAIDANDFSFAGEIRFNPGMGMFHMWLSPNGKQLWAAHNKTGKISISDPHTLEIIHIMNVPADISTGKAHDVIISPDNKYAYVTIIGSPSVIDTNYVIKYNTETFEEEGRIMVGFDSHVTLTDKNNKLYVASQNSDHFLVVNRETMVVEKVIPSVGAHGLAMSSDGDYIYVGYFKGNGTNAVSTFDIAAEEFIGSPVNSIQGNPHNLSLTPDNKKLYLTHTTNSASSVTVYNIGADHLPVFDKEVPAGQRGVGIFLVGDRQPKEYCQSNAVAPWQEWISQIKFGDMDNISAQDFSQEVGYGYGDYTNKNVALTQGKEIYITLKPTYTGTNFNENWKVWIDYNNDGDFTDSGEMVVNTNGVGAINTSFTIPADAPLVSTRMRVVMNRDNTPTPCASFVHGEVEDYTVTIVNYTTTNDCTSSGSQPWHEWIKRVQFGAIDNTSIKEGYGDFQEQRNRIDAGSTQPISLTTGFSYTNYDEYWSVWIDWNQDGEFQDTELALHQMNPAGQNGHPMSTITGSISIPDNAAIGTTKMRVSMKRDAFANACEHFDFGEVEDYSIFISPQGTDDVLGDDAPLMVVGDRKVNAITVINTITDQSVNIPMPFQPTDATPGYTYVVYEPHIQRVFVGDMVNDRLVAIDANDFSFAGEIRFNPGMGMFHMWLSPNGKQLWAAHNKTGKISISDPRTLEIIHIMNVPADISTGKAHDVIISPDNKYAYVTIIGSPSVIDTNYVIKYNTETFEEEGRIMVGFDSHVTLTDKNNKLYVASQNSDHFLVVNRETMVVEKVIPSVGAHGLAMSSDGDYIYVGYFKGNGVNAVSTFDIAAEEFIGSPVNSIQGNPHNLALTPDNKKLYLTHTTNSASAVTVYNIGSDYLPVFDKEVPAGQRGVGIALVWPRTAITTLTSKPQERNVIDRKSFDKAQREWAIYPNPLHSSSLFLSSNTLSDRQSMVRVLDIFGHVLKTKILDGDSSQIEINMDGISNGTYFINLITPGELPQTKRIVLLKE